MSSTVDGWFAVWTASRAEKKVASRIEAAGMEAWLPTIIERRRWSDRWRDVVMPLFPGYLFVRSPAAAWPRLLRVSGVLTVVKSGDGPAHLSDTFIADLRTALLCPEVQAAPVTQPIEYNRGDEVVVQEGPLTGLRGIVREIRSGRWLIVWIREIGRGAQFTIGSALVTPALD